MLATLRHAPPRGANRGSRRLAEAPVGGPLGGPSNLRNRSTSAAVALEKRAASRARRGTRAPSAVDALETSMERRPITISAVTIARLGAVLLCSTAAPAFAQENAERWVYFGEQHVHTSWSFDAFAFGNRITGPEEFYQYALGQPTLHPGGYKVTITRPLDWGAVTEHSEYMGMVQEA